MPSKLLLTRQVANLMPLSTDPAVYIPKMARQAREIFNALPKDEHQYKAVYKIVHSRQDKQKYERSVLRAEKFMKERANAGQEIGDCVADELPEFYKDQGWEVPPTDAVKVQMTNTLHHRTHVHSATLGSIQTVTCS